jgi:hypothetical protein
VSESDAFKYGAVQGPVSSSTARSTLQDLDPALYETISFFDWLLEREVGPRWRAELSALSCYSVSSPPSESDGYQLGESLDGYFPAGSVSLDPIPWLKQQQQRFPLLSLHRTTGTLSSHTRGWLKVDQTLELNLILPALDQRLSEALTPILHLCVLVLNHFCRQGFHSAYQSGRRVFGPDASHILGLTPVEHEQTMFVIGDQEQHSIPMPAMTMRLLLSERQNPPVGIYDQLEGIDGYYSIAETDLDV